MGRRYNFLQIRHLLNLTNQIKLPVTSRNFSSNFQNEKVAGGNQRLFSREDWTDTFARINYDLVVDALQSLDIFPDNKPDPDDTQSRC